MGERHEGERERGSHLSRGVSAFHDSHVISDSKRDGSKKRWIGYNQIFCCVHTFHESRVAFLALGNKVRVKLPAEKRNEKFRIIFRAVPHGNRF